MATIAGMDKHPYALAYWDWTAGKLELSFVGQGLYGGGPTPSRLTTNCHEAYRWASRQAARQYLQRSDHLTDKWRVLDLRQVEAPVHGEAPTSAPSTPTLSDRVTSNPMALATSALQRHTAIVELAKKNPPPQKWFDEDFSKLRKRPKSARRRQRRA